MENKQNSQAGFFGFPRSSIPIGILILPKCFALLIALILTTSLARAADPPAVEAYGMLPSMENARLSPDGSMLAFLAPVKGRRCTVIYRLDGQQNPNVICPGAAEVRRFHWKTNTRLVIGISETKTVAKTHVITVTQLVAINVDGSGQKLLVWPNQGFYINYQTDRVLDFLDDDPDHILVLTNRSSGTFPDVLKVDINSAAYETVVGARDSIWQWLTDQQGRPRLASALDHGKQQYLYRDDDGSDFVKIDGNDIIGDTQFLPLGFSDIPSVIFVRSKHETGRYCIYLYDVKNKKIIDRYAIEQDYDVSGLIWNGKHAVGYSYADDIPRQVFTDPVWKNDAALIAKQLPGANVLLVDRTKDGHRVLALVSEGNLPPEYYVLTRTPGQKTTLIAAGGTRSYIPDQSIATVKPINYRARDGLQIRAYLTMPKGGTKGPIPFVVLPHGGPEDRNYLGFDYIAQMIASRGYGVLQPNFRGSTGYGDAFLEAGFQEWGRKMQTDITDGTNWLIEQKLADPSRICIFGWSYGGYAALMGAVREPTLYRCAASMAGVTDLRHIQPASGQVMANRAVPQMDGDKSLIDENSPARNVSKINIPILLVHGRQDINVSFKDAEEMEQELRSAGKSVDTLFFDAEDHYLLKEGDRVAFLKKLDQFLRDNLGPAHVN